MSKNKHAKVEQHEADGKTQSLELQTLEVDAPVLPVDHMERLHSFRPDINDWIIEQTTKEAEFRREKENCVNRYIYVEHLLGQIFGFCIGIGGIIGGAVVAMTSSPSAGGTIASVAIGTLAVAFLRSKKQ